MSIKFNTKNKFQLVRIIINISTKYGTDWIFQGMASQPKFVQEPIYKLQRGHSKTKNII